MSFSVAVGGVPVIPFLESFILYYRFDLTPNAAAFERYYSAYLSVHSTAVTGGVDANTTINPWTGAGVPANIRIDQINANGPTGIWIEWASNDFHYYRVKCGHSHATLQITGQDVGGGNFPVNAGANWKLGAFAPPLQIKGGAPYMSQIVTVGNTNLPVHTTFYSQGIGKFAGYIGPFHNGTGFDSILASSAGRTPFPVVNLGVDGYDQFQANMAGVKGCALVVSGSFKKRLGLISRHYDDLLVIAAKDDFSTFILGLVSEMNLVPLQARTNVGLTVETCDELVLPQDESSDNPVEIVLFKP